MQRIIYVHGSVVNQSMLCGRNADVNLNKMKICKNMDRLVENYVSYSPLKTDD